MNSRQEFTRRGFTRSGFTLVEVMLALALSSVVLMAVSAAINIHLRVLDAGRTKVEEAQLARTVLLRIADDLRSAVRYEPNDSDQQEPAPEATDSTDPDTTDPNATAPDSLAPDPIVPDSTDLDPIDLAESDAPQMTPGLYGNLNQLQLDTSRLPRADQFGGVAVASDELEGQIGGPISDVKTVTYYVNDPSGSPGLVRREQDRATALWASGGMELDPSASLLEPLASEVAAIEFLYLEGLEWVEDWNSAQQKELPKAVKIAIWIIPVKLRGNDRETLSRTDCMVYRLTVHLPMAGEGGQ